MRKTERKLTHNDIFTLVNRIKPVPFDTKGHHISFQYVTDSRFTPKDKLLATLKNMIRTFREQANLHDLQYEVGQIRSINWPAPELCLQYRIRIWILKPKFYSI